jgi:signal transduction histidine kinase
LGGLPVKDEHGRALTADDIYRKALGGPTVIYLDTPDAPGRWYVVQVQRHADDFHNRILITLRDVTEERRLQQVRSEIVSIVSHDLRTPLAVVVGYLDLLRRPMSEEDRLKALDAAKRSAGRMADILEDLLSATRAEELLAPASLVPVPLAALAEDVVSSMAPTHTDREFAVAAECRPVVMGDEGRLRQALVNLVTNAFKYSPDGSPVSVNVTCGADRAQLAVEDAGTGVAEGDRLRIFERFARLEGDREHQAGAGLGLYIVRIVSENHGGHVSVEESSLGGARFVIDLPWGGDLERTTGDRDGSEDENRTPAAARTREER